MNTCIARPSRNHSGARNLFRFGVRSRLGPENVFTLPNPRTLKRNQFRAPKSLLRSSLCALCVLLWQSALADVHYVDLNSTNATPPYSSWSTAATNIQDAVDAAVAGDEIVVTNGTYATGGRATFDGTLIRVAVDKPLSVRSVNGPQFTIIDGGGSNRCAYVTDGATLSNFTLTNGYVFYYGGGGVLCAPNAVVSNCVITGNRHDLYQESPFGSGGAYGGTLNNCTLTGNSTVAADFSFFGHASAYGGGAYASTLNNCTLTANSAKATVGQAATAKAFGGGAAYCALNNCVFSGNRAFGQSFLGSVSALDSYGGGTYECTLKNCKLTNNSAIYGGGAYGCALNNCTLTGHRGTGAYSSALSNCIVYFNGENYQSCTLNYSCTTPQPTNGVGNITNAPLFVDQASGNLRLQSNSPCINAGNNSYVTNATDLDGNPRIAGGTVDIGAYEFQSPASMISYAWLQHFNLPINPLTDAADPDGDGVNNYHEWLARSDPTNPLSSPAQLTIIASGTDVILMWSTNAVGFTLQSTTNLVSPSVWTSNSPAPFVIGWQNVVTNSLSGPQQFYRLSQ